MFLDTIQALENRLHGHSILETKQGQTVSDPAALRNICITSEGIKKLLQNLKANKAAGLNEIWPKVLIELAPIIAPVLQVLFIRSHSPQRLENGGDQPSLQKG